MCPRVPCRCGTDCASVNFACASQRRHSYIFALSPDESVPWSSPRPLRTDFTILCEPRRLTARFAIHQSLKSEQTGCRKPSASPRLLRVNEFVALVDFEEAAGYAGGGFDLDPAQVVLSTVVWQRHDTQAGDRPRHKRGRHCGAGWRTAVPRKATQILSSPQERQDWYRRRTVSVRNTESCCAPPEFWLPLWLQAVVCGSEQISSVVDQAAAKSIRYITGKESVC